MLLLQGRVIQRGWIGDHEPISNPELEDVEQKGFGAVVLKVALPYEARMHSTQAENQST